MSDLDVRLAQMMGWTYTEDEDIGGGRVRRWSHPERGWNHHYSPASFSMDIAACFEELVPWLYARKWQLISLGEPVVLWVCAFENVATARHGQTVIREFGETPEMAIAVAAEAVGKAEGWIK